MKAGTRRIKSSAMVVTTLPEGPERVIYCNRHFPDAAKAWYDDALKTTYGIIADAERMREEETAKLQAKLVAKQAKAQKPPKASATQVEKPSVEPTRKQPRRNAKEQLVLKELETSSVESLSDSGSVAEAEVPSPHPDPDPAPAPVPIPVPELSRTVLKKIAKLLDSAPLPLDFSKQPMDGTSWAKFLHAMIDAETRRLFFKISARNTDCPYGFTPWICNDCQAEIVQQRAPDPPAPESAEEKTAPEGEEGEDWEVDLRLGLRDGQGAVAPEANMDIVGDKAFGVAQKLVAKIKVPKDRIMAIGGFRFVLDICDGVDKYMLLEDQVGYGKGKGERERSMPPAG